MTLEEINDEIEISKIEMESSIDHLKHVLGKLQTGKASTSILSDIVVEYYGAPTPLNQAATVTTADARTLTIKPYDKSLLPVIERAIFEANLGFTPQNDGEIIRINIPPLTEERRKELVKKAKGDGEDAKVSLRNTRQKIMSEIKKAVKNGLSEDMGKRKEDEVQKIVNGFGDKVNALVAAKEQDIMTI